ncbi:GntR family transcriptional regulator [Promicromonospora kroppenstedtii]|uniref:GntR family transcriptional regulator n=1 Tax=Promicromonospora kroppenstedtii TaxID=440482 RepID=UPI0004B567A6|nr:GntR family transcriptional regulator [Promicromonospora kroppenstedtii]
MSTPPLLTTARVRGENTRRLVHTWLRRQIIGLELAPGEPLSEAEIGSRLGVSRTPVRESLILLAEEGLVEVFPQRGSFVGPIRYEDVVSAQFVREAIECSSLEQGGSLVTAGDVAELRALIVRQHEAERAEDAGAFFDLDEEFHLRLMRACGHESAWRIVASAKAQMDRARRLSLPEGGKMTGLIEQHESVVDALDLGDVVAAVARLREHLRVVLQDITHIQAERPELFARA